MASSKELSDAASAPGPDPKTIELDGKLYEPIKEGLATILRPVTGSSKNNKNPKDGGGSEQQQASVFYNPIQQFNRDLSVLAIKVFANSFVALSREKAAITKKRQKNKGKGKKRKREEENGDNDEGELPREFKKHEGEQEKEKEEPDLKGQQQDNTEPTADAVVQKKNHSTNGHIEGVKPVNFRILDALSATGLRALRYAKEIPIATRVVSNDLSASAIEVIKLNIKYNEVENIVQPNIGDARAYLYSLYGDKPPNKSNDGGEVIGKFDVIDLDPYGTAGPFLDASIQGLNNGGLLCVTCTDAAVFASTGYPEKAFSLYGGVPVRLPYGHEVGLRLIINAIATSAARYGLAIEPLLSLSIDYYVRVFVRVHKSPAEVKFLSGNTMLVYTCDAGCGAWTTQYLTQTRLREGKNGSQSFYQHSLALAPTTSQLCEHCGFKTHLAGPMWGGPLHNSHFIQRMLNMLPDLDPETYQTLDRIEGMLTTALEEDLDLHDPSPGDQSRQSAETATATASQDKAQPDETITLKTDSSPIIPRMPPHLQEHYPFFVSLNALSKVLHTETPPMNAFRGALHGLGYRTTRSHTRPNSVRTDAPWDVLWEIMREWVRELKRDSSSFTSTTASNPSNLKPGTAGAGIMKKDRSRFDENNALCALQREISQALEEGKDVSDLTTRIEAALYRRGNKRYTGAGDAPVPPAPAPASLPNTKEGAGVSQKNEDNIPPHPSTLKIVFDENLGKEFSTSTRAKKVVRYQMNPEAHWGPINKAARN